MKSIFDKDYLEIVAALKKSRLKQKYTQKKFARKLGHSQSYVSKVEHGQVRLDLVQLKQYSSALGLNARDLIK